MAMRGGDALESKRMDQFSSAITKQIQAETHGWIQWKGTAVCMDFHCKCGCAGHIDDEFVYYVECPECHTLYEVSGFVEMIEADEENRYRAKHCREDI